ncbi:hypothetical protein AB6A40_003073 [Gnathostoma spinigerum]|uniref:Uncharacterized protein n=1 Tax=Gnathostoma spinigerum TaxID=75299 RepID=A0ABD6E8G8_9BILA
MICLYTLIKRITTSNQPLKIPCATVQLNNNESSSDDYHILNYQYLSTRFRMKGWQLRGTSDKTISLSMFE